MMGHDTLMENLTQDIGHLICHSKQLNEEIFFMLIYVKKKKVLLANTIL